MAIVFEKQTSTVFVIIRSIWDQLNRRRKYQCLLLLGLMVFSAFTEMISLGAVVPFLGVLSEPENVFQYAIIADLAPIFGITSAEQLIFPITAVFCLAALISGTIRIMQLWASTRIAYSVGHDLSTSAFLRTLYQPYEQHLERNSSEVIAGVHKVDNVFVVLIQMFILVNAVIMSITVIVALTLIDPFIAMLVFVGFGGIYGMITLLTKRRLSINSKKVAREEIYRLKALQENT